MLVVICFCGSAYSAQLRQFRLLPQAFQYGFAYAYKVHWFRYLCFSSDMIFPILNHQCHSQNNLWLQSALARNAFLMGSHSAGGWKSFFPIAVAIKTPVAVLVMIAVSLLLLLLRIFFRLPLCPIASKSSGSPLKPSLFPALIIPFCSSPSISTPSIFLLKLN